MPTDIASNERQPFARAFSDEMPGAPETERPSLSEARLAILEFCTKAKLAGIASDATAARSCELLAAVNRETCALADEGAALEAEIERATGCRPERDVTPRQPVPPALRPDHVPQGETEAERDERRALEAYLQPIRYAYLLRFRALERIALMRASTAGLRSSANVVSQSETSTSLGVVPASRNGSRNSVQNATSSCRRMQLASFGVKSISALLGQVGRKLADSSPDQKGDRA